MLLHVLNGDATRIPLELSGVPGKTAVIAEVLHDGPVPDVPADELLEIRAKHYATFTREPTEEVLAGLRSWYSPLDRYREYEEVVFWFEHDLFDQVLLIRHLDWLSSIDPGTTRFSLICIGAFPGRPTFAGLGELTPGELAVLFPARRPVTPEQVELSRRAWSVFRASDPTRLTAWLDREDSSALPFLAGALRRHLEDFPSTSNGLARTETQILRALDHGYETMGEVFAASQRSEERIYMGDLTFWQIVRRLASAPHPLVQIAGDEGREEEVRNARLAVTIAGRDVLSGNADHIALNGIDRWMGGAHLTTECHWRWDGAGVIPVVAQ